MPLASRLPARQACGALAAALVTLMGAAGCGADAPDPQQATPVAVADPVDPATAGRISGTIALQGTAPAPLPVNTKSDPNCTAPVTTEEIVAGTGSTLQNVFVYVRDGLGDLVFPVPDTPVVLSQDGCSYRPRVLGIQVGQTLDIVNGDDTLHNVHAVPTLNQEFNKAQQFKGFRNTHVFTRPEVLVRFTCDVHRWMRAYVGVVDHPFFAVSGADGSFELSGVPPGTYTIDAVHETLGTQTLRVTVTERSHEQVTFTFTL